MVYTNPYWLWLKTHSPEKQGEGEEAGEGNKGKNRKKNVSRMESVRKKLDIKL